MPVMEGGATPSLSVVVPAHNEEAVIARCLTALLQDVAPDVIDVVVVCNGCTDRTADIAASFGVRVLSTPAASKSAALNLGDDAARHFPRAYADADVEVTGAALMQTASALAGGALAAAPGLQLDLAGRSWAVRSYYRVWSRMRDAASDVTGSGAYVLSEDGRLRFD